MFAFMIVHQRCEVLEMSGPSFPSLPHLLTWQQSKGAVLQLCCSLASDIPGGSRACRCLSKCLELCDVPKGVCVSSDILQHALSGMNGMEPAWISLQFLCISTKDISPAGKHPAECT